LIRVTAYYLTRYRYYSGWRVPALRFLYKVRYRTRRAAWRRTLENGASFTAFDSAVLR
jgi:hypothetical protein